MMNRLRVFASLPALIGATVAMAAEPARGVERNSKVYPYLNRLADGVTPKLAWKAKTPAEHAAWRRTFKTKLRDLLGHQPEAVPLNVQWVDDETLETDRFVRRKVYIQSEGDYWVPAYYFLPHERADKTPALICLHGHSGIVPYIREGDAKQRKKAKAHALDYAVTLAERGTITLAVVQRGWNETRHDDPHSCHRLAMSAFLLGRTVIGMRVWDAMRCLDFLQTRPEVDPKRIGAAGLSGGGTTTLFFAAMDDRVSLALCAGYFCTFRDSIYDIHHCICNCVPGIMEWGEMSDVAALIAPRPFLVIAGTRDRIFPIEATRRAYDALARTYDLLGAPDHLDHDFFDGPHAWSNRKTLPFLTKHWGPLKNNEGSLP